MKDLLTLKTEELRAGLDSKQFSSEELVKASLSRVGDSKELNCFIEVTADLALAAAKDADRRLAKGERGGLLGIPVAVKDNIVMVGAATSCGSKILSEYRPPYDATVVTKLRQSGAVVVGKTNLDEFAMGSSSESSFFGPTKNPWDNTLVPGGSSGGSAVAVASSQCSVALGSDTGGSIRLPASYCNLVGLKPTYGRVSRYGLVAYASSFDQVGPMSRTVSGTAIALQTIAGHDPSDSTSVPRDREDFLAATKKGVKGLKIGVPKEYFVDGLDAEVNAAMDQAVKEFKALGAQIVNISLPYTQMAVPTYYILVPAEAASNLSRYDGVRYGYRAKDVEDLEDLYFETRSAGFGKEVKRRILIGTYVLSTGYYDAYYLRAQKVRTLIATDFKNAFKDHCDLILAPTSPTPPFKIGEKVDDPIQMYLMDIFTVPANLAGLPAISIPCGFTKSSLPIGLQLIGRPWEEGTLLQAAGAYESVTKWTEMMPTSR